MEAKPTFKSSVMKVRHGFSSCQLLDPHLLPTCSSNMIFTTIIAMATMVTIQANTGGGKEQRKEIVIGLELHSTEHPC